MLQSVLGVGDMGWKGRGALKCTVFLYKQCLYFEKFWSSHLSRRSFSHSGKKCVWTRGSFPIITYFQILITHPCNLKIILNKVSAGPKVLLGRHALRRFREGTKSLSQNEMLELLSLDIIFWGMRCGGWCVEEVTFHEWCYTIVRTTSRPFLKINKVLFVN